LGILPAKVVILLISSSYQQNVTVVIVKLSPNNLGFIDKWRYHYTTSGLRHYLKLGISIYWSLDYLMNPFGTAAVAEMITEKNKRHAEQTSYSCDWHLTGLLFSD